MPGLFVCRICGADSSYEVCNACVPPTIRSRRVYEEAKRTGRKVVYDDYYMHLGRGRPKPQREETPLPEED